MSVRFRGSNIQGVGRQVQLALNALYRTFAPTPWQNVTFQNGWSNHGAPYSDVQYRRAADLVQVRGAGDGSLGVVAFTLPLGFRPPATFEMNGITGTNHARVYVESDGEVIPQGSGSTSEFHFNFMFATDDLFPNV
jgi:hypothetical protein